VRKISEALVNIHGSSVNRTMLQHDAL